MTELGERGKQALHRWWRASVCVSQCIVRLISQQPPAETHCFISISNSFEGKLIKWHANCCNGLFLCTSPVLALSPAPLLQPLSSPFTLYYNDLLPFFFLSLAPRTHEHGFVSDSLMRSAFPLNRQKKRMHQLTPTYKQYTHIFRLVRFLCVCLRHINRHSKDWCIDTLIKMNHK